MHRVPQTWLDRAQKMKEAERLRLMARLNMREVEVLRHVITYVRKGRVLATYKLIQTLTAEAQRWEAEAAAREREAWRKRPEATPSPEMSNDIKDLGSGVRV